MAIQSIEVYVMRAGSLRHRIVIQQPTTGTNAQGGKTKAWEDVVTVWAAIEPLRGREYLEAHQIEAEISARISIRYRSGLDTHMRIQWGSRYYKIDSIINPQERDAMLVIMAVETKDYE